MCVLWCATWDKVLREHSEQTHVPGVDPHIEELQRCTHSSMASTMYSEYESEIDKLQASRVWNVACCTGPSCPFSIICLAVSVNWLVKRASVARYTLCGSTLSP